MSAGMNTRETVLHGTALKRNSTAPEIAGIIAMPVAEVEAQLAAAVAGGRVMANGDRYMVAPLTDVTLRARYPLVFGALREDSAFVQPYEAFERVNVTLKQVITDWQTMTVGGKAVANDHSDEDYDADVIDRLGAVHEQVEPILTRLAARLPRLKVYSDKLLEALEKAEDGDHEWVSDIRRESYHTVWFELHEDLLRIMGREREE
ncbi:hypothetical protein [Croceicoccus bisphenolivorans]|uniref:hypothetical protein n=1 Tax=Croceicoccus bisphenolivorans TaxID=1783232 RepID=UPI00082CA9BF|nr:hypothetical protein [Croceicoccus bisphenolivorans]